MSLSFLCCLMFILFSLFFLSFVLFYFFFFKQKTAYEMRISDWSSDVCSSDLHGHRNTSHANDGHWGIPDGSTAGPDIWVARWGKAPSGPTFSVRSEWPFDPERAADTTPVGVPPRSVGISIVRRTAPKRCAFTLDRANGRASWREKGCQY